MRCFPKAGWGQLQADAHRRAQWVSVMETEPCDGPRGHALWRSQIWEAVLREKQQGGLPAPPTLECSPSAHMERLPLGVT